MRPYIPEAKIKEIYLGYVANEPKQYIAQRLKIDRHTVYDYIRKIERHDDQIIALLVRTDRPKCVSGHTALRCLVCGITSDNMRSSEFQEIIMLRKEVESLKQQLKTRNEVHITRNSSSVSSPVVRVAG